MRSPVRIWVAAPKKAPADAGAFWFVRLPPVGGGYPICGSVSAAPGGLSGIALGFSWGFARRLHPRLSACGLARFSFIIINHKTSVNAGRLCLRVCAFAAVCGISLPCAAFSFAAELPQIPAKMRDLRRNHFFAVGTHSRSVLRLSAEKIFLRTRAVGRRCLSDGFSVRIAGGENAFVKAPKNDTFCKFERKFIHFTQFFIDKRRCLPYN